MARGRADDLRTQHDCRDAFTAGRHTIPRLRAIVDHESPSRCTYPWALLHTGTIPAIIWPMLLAAGVHHFGDGATVL